MSRPTHDQTQITSRYRMIGQLGAGGMGEVNRVHDRLSGHDVALKRVTLELAGAPEDVAAARLALAHEFRTLAGLRHPHIISVLDYGFDAQRQPYFTMELLDGAQPILAAARELPLDQRLALLAQALEALAYLHRRGVLHHDLKPENVLIAAGRARLLDFGLAVVASQQRDDDAFGTLQYLAPEVLDGQPYTEAADLYSLGVIAYELLLGSHPFPAKTLSAYIERLFNAPPDLAEVADQPALAGWLGQLLAKTPAGRPASAQAALAALRAVLGQPEQALDAAIRESYLQAASFVGRADELAQLNAALEQARQGRGSSWLIGGESGVGKSRLLDELRTQALVQGFSVLRGQAVEGGGLPYTLWRDPLRQLIVETPAIDELTASVLLPLVPDIASLLGRPVAAAPALDEQAAQTRLLSTIAALFRQQRQPIVLLLEDLHWAEESLLPLSFLNRSVAEQSLLVLASYRDDERPALPQQLPEMHTCPLARLSAASVAALSAAILGEAGHQPALLELLQRETEGNTFFLVEVVRALAEDTGQLAAIGRAELPAQLMPEGIQTLIGRRLARIPAAAQPLLAQAAVAGRQLDLALLRALAPDLDLAGWWLPLCAEAAVLEAQGERWQFAHDKIRHSLLAQLTPAQAQAQHGSVAGALEQLYGADDQRAAQLAYHWGQAGQAHKQADYAFRGGRYARQQASLAEALRLLNQAQAGTLSEEQARRCAIHLQRGAVQEILGAWAEAEHDYRAGGELAATAQERASAQLALGKLDRLRGEHETAQSWLALALSDYRTADDQPGQAQALLETGFVLTQIGDYAQANTQLQAGLALARGAGDQTSIALALNNLAQVAYFQSDFAASLQRVAESLALRRAIGDRLGIATSLSNLGLTHRALGNYAEAKALMTESLTLRREIGDRFGTSTTLNNLSLLALDLHEYPEAQVLLEECLLLARELGDKIGIAYALHNLGGVAFGLGRYDQALALYSESLALCEESGDKFEQVLNQLGLAQVAIAQRQAELATRLAASAETLLAEIGGQLTPTNRSTLDDVIASARAMLGEQRFTAIWAGADAPSPHEIESA